MAYSDLDIRVLRSFVTGVELGNFARAADRLGLSTSAISAQMKRLEEQLGDGIFRKAGRGLELTPSGEVLLSYACRLLELNDETVGAMKGQGEEGCISLGLQHDFAPSLLPGGLARFARTHPNIKLDVRVARNQDLLKLVSQGAVDFALGWEDRTTPVPYVDHVQDLEMCWLGPQDALQLIAGWDMPLSLVSYDENCRFRKEAISALDRQNKPWRLALTSPDLSGVVAAVSAGLGLTVRTRLNRTEKIRIYASNEYDLPPLPHIGISVYRSQYKLTDMAHELMSVICDEIKKCP